MFGDDPRAARYVKNCETTATACPSASTSSKPQSSNVLRFTVNMGITILTASLPVRHIRLVVHIIDESKAFFPDFRHRALRHHAEGIFLCERFFGVTITNSEGKQVPVRYIGEQHVKEDLGRIPSAQDWLSEISPRRWMYGQPIERAVSKS